MREKEYRIDPGGFFNEHTTYVFEGWEVDQEKSTVRLYSAAMRSHDHFDTTLIRICCAQVRAAFSSENLMLNAYRQEAAGNVPFLALDFTYRIFHEGHGLMPIMTISPDQKGHIIAYAISDSEDGDAHTMLLEIIKKQVENVVRFKSEAEGVSNTINSDL